ncbi:MAG: hypothetical protein JWL75_107 [Parcubacteria group bacterium]|nr:hypothetical protein [Parcubacteria group bacterium]
MSENASAKARCLNESVGHQNVDPVEDSALSIRYRNRIGKTSLSEASPKAQALRSNERKVEVTHRER